MQQVVCKRVLFRNWRDGIKVWWMRHLSILCKSTKTCGASSIASLVLVAEPDSHCLLRPTPTYVQSIAHEGVDERLSVSQVEAHDLQGRWVSE